MSRLGSMCDQMRTAAPARTQQAEAEAGQNRIGMMSASRGPVLTTSPPMLRPSQRARPETKACSRGNPRCPRGHPHNLPSARRMRARADRRSHLGRRPKRTADSRCRRLHRRSPESDMRHKPGRSTTRASKRETNPAGYSISGRPGPQSGISRPSSLFVPWSFQPGRRHSRRLDLIRPKPIDQAAGEEFRVAVRERPVA